MKRYTDHELIEFKKLIENKLQTAEKELSIISEQLEEVKTSAANNQGGDISEENSMTAEKNMLVKKANRQQQFTKNLKNALIRIENKTYGICSITGDLIDKKRLLLVPHATKSIVANQSSAANSNASKGKARIIKPSSTKKIITKLNSKATKSSHNTSNTYEDLDDLDKNKVDEIDLMLKGIEELDLKREEE